VALRWPGVPGADRYEVELSPRTRFDADVLTLDAGGATELVLPGVVPAAGHKMLWRVRAHVGRGATAWSRYGRFYPADADTAERFSLAMDRARTAQRLQRDHARRVQQREMDLIPLHERPDAVTSQAMVTAILAMVVSSGLLIALAAVFAAARESGGVAVVLWHNQLGADTAAWEAGVDALDHALGQARADSAGIGPLEALLSAWNRD